MGVACVCIGVIGQDIASGVGARACVAEPARFDSDGSVVVGYWRSVGGDQCIECCVDAVRRRTHLLVCTKSGHVVDVCANGLCGQAIKVGLVHDQHETPVVQRVAVSICIAVGLGQGVGGELRVGPEVKAFHIAVGLDGATDPTVIGVASDDDGCGRDVVATEHLASAVVIDAHISQRIAVIEVVQVLLFGGRRFCWTVDDAVVVQVIDHGVGIDEFEGRKFNLKGFAAGCDPARIVVQGRFGSVTPVHQR